MYYLCITYIYLYYANNFISKKTYKYMEIILRNVNICKNYKKLSRGITEINYNSENKYIS